MKTDITWDQLLASLNDATSNPEDTAWNIYRYMQANIGEGLSSEEARTLLACYVKLPVRKPSLLHSLMLSIATRMSELYADFRYINFLNVWQSSNLRTEDQQPQQGKDGKVYASLIEKVTKAYIRYRMTHAEETLEDSFRRMVNVEAARLGFRPMQQMIAVKAFETEHNGRKVRSVKLVGSDGAELIADSHSFACKPWEICGRMYDVMPRVSKTGTLRAEYICESQRSMAEAFPPTVGFVEHYDAQHDHIHVFDNQSRHFVAEGSKVKPAVGSYVLFSPVIPAVDKFKSAIILRVLDKYEARERFGAASARVAFVDTEKGYLKYVTEDKREGFCQLARCPQGTKQGDSLRLIIFLKRGKDGEKRPYVGEAF